MYKMMIEVVCNQWKVREAQLYHKSIESPHRTKLHDELLPKTESDQLSYSYYWNPS